MTVIIIKAIITTLISLYIIWDCRNNVKTNKTNADKRVNVLMIALALTGIYTAIMSFFK